MNVLITLNHFCEHHGPKVIMCTMHQGQGENSKQDAYPHVSVSAPKEDVQQTSSERRAAPLISCPGCSSLPANVGSFRTGAYLSVRWARQEALFRAALQAATRSLSCEVCPGREGPIFFGDAGRAQVLCHTFKLCNRIQRGGKSHFSIALVSRDRSFILNNWPFLVEQLQRLIGLLQARCKETSQLEATCLGHTGIASRHLRCIPLNVTRSLADLMQDQHCFHRLHMCFVWLLRAAAARCREIMVLGPASEDELLAKEMAEESLQSSLIDNELEQQESSRDTMDSFTTASLNHKDDSAIDSCVFRGPRHVFKILGNSKFGALLQHVLVGDQLVVHTDFTSLALSIFSCLGDMLPRGCLTVVENSPAYVESFRANLVHLRLAAPLPQIPLNLAVLVLRIDAPSTSTELTLNPKPEQLLYQLRYLHEASSTLAHNAPQIVSEYVNLLSEPLLCDTAAHLALRVVKERWLNRAKLVHGLRRSCVGPNATPQKLLALMTGPAINCTSTTDQQLVMFWTKGLSSSYKVSLTARLSTTFSA